MVRSYFLTRIRAQSYYEYTRVSTMLLTHESVLTVVESLNCDDCRPESLGISHVDNVGFLTMNTEELLSLIKAARNFV